MSESRPGFLRPRNILIGFGILLFVLGFLITQITPIQYTAERVKCIGHQKHIGLAVHNYHDVHNRFPSAVFPHPTLSSENRLSWFVAILPYIEQESLFKQLNIEDGFNEERNMSRTRTKIPQYLCPTFFDQSAFVTTYVGVSGVGLDAATYDSFDKRRGIFGYDRRLSRFQVTDGTSTTLLVIESWADSTSWARGGPGTVRGFDPATIPYIGHDRPFRSGHPLERRWFSPNSVMITAVLADGSTYSLREGMDPKILEALATVAGGEEVNWDW